MAVEARLVASLQTGLESRVPVAVGVYRGEVVVACPGGAALDTKASITLHRIYSRNKEPVVLYGHCDIVSALALSAPCPDASTAQSSLSAVAYLCSASADSVLLWNLNSCYEQHTAGSLCNLEWKLDGFQSGSCSYVELALPLAKETTICHVSFSPNAQSVVVCRGKEAFVYSTKSCEVDTTLVGHTASVTSAVFSPHNHHKVITVSEDRTFKIWDLSSSSLVYQSAVISASPFLCAALALHGDYLATGIADGVIRIYDLGEHQGYKCLHKIDVAIEVDKLHNSPPEDGTTSDAAIITSSPQWKQNSLVEVTPGATIECGLAVLGLFYWPPSNAGDASSPASEILSASPVLLAVTNTLLLVFNAQTMELTKVVDFRDTCEYGAHRSVPTTAACSFSFNPLTNEVCCALGSMFSSSVSVLILVDPQQHRRDGITDRGSDCNPELADVVTVLSCAPLVQNSPLSAEFTFKTKTSSAGASKAHKGSSRGTKSALNQPLTFKSKVKSSGYSETPRSKMFTPRTRIQKTTMSPRGSKVSELKKPEYPMACGPVSQLAQSVDLTDRPTPISSITFSGDGQYLACGCADKASYTVRMPPSYGRIHAFVGHDSAVLSTCWNHSGQWLLTSSTDKTARVWASGHKDPLLTIDRVRHNFTTGASKDSKLANGAFVKEITSAKFYYLDKFLLLTSANGLYLYKYNIDITKPDDIKRYLTDSRYKLVTSLSMDSAQTITAMSTINDFHSYIVLLGGSNKAIQVMDMNTGSTVRTIQDAHSRAVHCISQNSGSRYTSLPPSAYDLFLTSAITDGIKLWDLRSTRCVSRFTSHINQSHQVSAAISPCARFVATGSEDRSVYVYDMRYPSPLHRVTGHSDVVSTVAYHPLRSMLGAATLDGKITFLTEKQVQ